MIESLASLKAATIIFAVDAFGAKPNDSLPGGSVIEKLVGGAMRWGQYAVVAALVVGVIMWIVGSKGHNPQHAAGGKMILLAACVGAVVIGGANAIGESFYDLGTEVK